MVDPIPSSKHPSYNTEGLLKNGPSSSKLMQYAVFLKSSATFLGKYKNKQTKQTFFKLINVI